MLLTSFSSCNFYHGETIDAYFNLKNVCVRFLRTHGEPHTAQYKYRGPNDTTTTSTSSIGTCTSIVSAYVQVHMPSVLNFTFYSQMYCQKLFFQIFGFLQPLVFFLMTKYRLPPSTRQTARNSEHKSTKRNQERESQVISSKYEGKYRKCQVKIWVKPMKIQKNR